MRLQRTMMIDTAGSRCKQSLHFAYSSLSVDFSRMLSLFAADDNQQSMVVVVTMMSSLRLRPSAT